MAKYNDKFVSEMVSWVEEHGLMDYGGAKFTDFLRYFKIDDRTYYNWYKKKPEYKQAIDNAKEKYKKALTRDLVTSLATAAKGYDKDIVETEFVPSKGNESKPTIKVQRKKTLHFMPNIGAAIFLLTNLDPEHYQNRQHTDIGGKIDTKIEIGMVDADVAPVENEEDIED